MYKPSKRPGITAVALLIGALVTPHCGGERQRNENTDVRATALDFCSCPAMNDGVGAVARIFAGGPPGVDNLLVEDARSRDAYRYVGPSWKRIGSSARTYALRTNVYRLAGDGFAEMAVDNLDHWTRFGASRVGSELFTSNDKLYMSRVGSTSAIGALYRWDGTAATIVDTLPVGIPGLYAGTDSGIYKAVSGLLYKYNASTAVWVQIGSTPASALYSAAGTVFVRNGASTLRYDTSNGQLGTQGTALGKVVGTLTDAWAIDAAANVVRLEPGGIQTIVRSGGDVRDIVAGGAHLFALTAAGAILRMDAPGTWADLSCTGSVSAVGCADGCEPGPTPTKIAPNYSDLAQQSQVATTSIQYDVLTQHNNVARTGAATHENILTPAAVKAGSFGYLGSVPVDGRIYGQPLYVENAAVLCDGQLRNANIAYVGTLENTVYAIDVDQRSICWTSGPLGCPQSTRGVDVAGSCDSHAEDGACNDNFNANDTSPKVPNERGVRVGIVSTPVIDLAKSIMYLVARHRNGSDARGRFFVHVIDTRTGQLVSKVEAIADTLNGRDDCNNKPFHPSLSTQRAGLLLLNDRLFVAFSGNAGEDSTVEYYGHTLGFDVSNPANPTNLSRSFCATPNAASNGSVSRGGGTWMAGGGIASDGTNSYFSTGNGAYEYVGGQYLNVPEAPPPGNWPDSFVKLSPAMTGVGYVDTRYATDVSTSHPPTLGGHTMFYGRERSDADFGSGGVIVIGNRMIGGGKDGRLYVIDTSTMSRVQDFQAFVNLYSPNLTYDFTIPYYAGPHIHGSAVAWDVRPAAPYVYVYLWSEKDVLKRFRFDPTAGKFVLGDAVDAFETSPFPTAHGDIASSAPGAMPGGMLSLSSNGTAGGIVWATVQEPYKFCSKVDAGDGRGPRVLVDQPSAAGGAIGGCTVMGGYVPGRLYAFSADVDPLAPGAKRLKLLWGDTSATGLPTSAFPGTSVSPNNFIPAYSKHAPPTIAHGKVLIATANGELRIYGLGATVGNGPKQRISRELKFDDIALTGSASWPGIDVAASNGDGSFMATSFTSSSWSTWASTVNVGRLIGDYNGDGRTDIALLGGQGWTQVKVAFANGDGTFGVQQGAAPSFLGWSTSTSAKRLVGDFDGDGKSDLALVGDPSFTTIPVATSTGDGSFSVTNGSSPSFALWAGAASEKAIGDFDGDGRSDIALIGGATWHTIPIAHGRGAGTFEVANGDAGELALNWAPIASERVVGDFNGDGRDDIALVGNAAWSTIPVAFADGVGAFRVVNDVAHGVGAFARWASMLGVTRLVGDFNGDGRADIALINVPAAETSASIPVAFSNGDGSFRVVALAFPDGGFASWAAAWGVHPIVGDFNRDGYADVALTGGAGWYTIPCALSKGDGTFQVVNSSSNLTTFGSRSAAAGVSRSYRLGGNYR